MEIISDERLKKIAEAESVWSSSIYWSEALPMARELRAYRESGALRALRLAAGGEFDPDCDCEYCRQIVNDIDAALSALEAIEK